MQYIIADIGATTVRAAVMDYNGNIIEESRSLSATGGEMLDIVLKQLEALKKSRSITAAAVACSGIIEDGVVVYSPNLEWKDVKLSELIFKRLNVPVTLLNDANAAALGEYNFGAGKGADELVMLTLGTGVGGAYIKNGNIVCKRGGEFGHIIIRADGRPCRCGMNGCLEAYTSDSALIAGAKRMMDLHKDSQMHGFSAVNASTPFLAEALGDSYAKDIVEEFIHYLSLGIAGLNNIFRPGLIVLGGGVSSEGEKLLSRLRSSLAAISYGYKNVSPPRIVPARLGGNAGLFGAYASLVKNQNS